MCTCEHTIDKLRRQAVHATQKTFSVIAATDKYDEGASEEQDEKLS